MMKVLSKIKDEKIDAWNISVELSVSEFLKYSEDILEKNPFQRGKVKKSKTVYSLLKEDLKDGCTIPPLVLAISGYIMDEVEDKDHNLDAFEEKTNQEIKKEIEDYFKHERGLIILDGLQRTYTLIDVKKELENKTKELEEFLDKTLRVEVFYGINKLGILYRMLTLNTGQTPMSLRHQIEILYSDYIERDIEGIELTRKTEKSRPTKPGQYRFKNMIEGFNSYLEREEFPIGREDVVENIKSLEKLSKENRKEKIFEKFVITYDQLVKKVNSLASKWDYIEDDFDFGNPFGKDPYRIFYKSQPITGFGAAAGKLKNYGVIETIDDIGEMIEDIYFRQDVSESMNELIRVLEKVRSEAAKIGKSQRMYFHHFFRELFNINSDAHLCFDQAINDAYKVYLSKVG